jgi:curved DNA-binding protein CbpA
MNYYEILCIPLDADDEMIRSAFRSLARRYHPGVDLFFDWPCFRR